MSDTPNTMSEKQQYTVESEKKQQQNTDIESQTSDPTTPPPARPAFLILWLLFVLGTIGTIVASNWNKPDFPIHATNTPKHHPSPSRTALPTSAPTSTCGSLSIRREWRTMKAAEQASYEKALRCLIDLPSKNGNAGSRLSDFLGAHEAADWHATSTSAYLPWNRLYMHTLETAMRRECAYTGDMAYLDWTLAISPPEQTSTPSPSTPQTAMLDSSKHLDATLVSEILDAETYDDFTAALESRIRDLAPFDFESGSSAQGKKLHLPRIV